MLPLCFQFVARHTAHHLHAVTPITTSPVLHHHHHYQVAYRHTIALPPQSISNATYEGEHHGVYYARNI